MTIQTIVLVCGILAVCGTVTVSAIFAYKFAMAKLVAEERIQRNAAEMAERILDKTEKVVDKIIDRTFPSNNRD